MQTQSHSARAILFYFFLPTLADSSTSYTPTFNADLILDLLDDNPNHTFTFNVITDAQFATERSQPEPRRDVLPPQFAIFLSYMPNNNTVLKLLTMDTYMVNYTSEQSDPIITEYETALYLSKSVTHVGLNAYVDLWTNLSQSDFNRLVLVVTGHGIGSCLEGEYIVPSSPTRPWFADPSEGQVQIILSQYITEAYRIVSTAHGT